MADHKSHDMVSSALTFMQDFTRNSIGVNRIVEEYNWYGSQRGDFVGMLVVTTLLALLFWQFGRRISQPVRANPKLPLPPGSFGLPFLGETLSFLVALYVNNPERFFLSRAAKYGKVFKTSLFGWPVVSVDAPAGNKFIFASDGKLLETCYPKSIVEIIGKEAFLNLPHGEHRRLRRIIVTCLSGETLQSFTPRMEATVLAHLAEFWEGKERVMGVDSIKRFSFQLSCELFLGLKDGPELQKLEADYKILLDGLMSLPVNLPGFRYRKSLAMRPSVLAFLDTCIHRRREELREGRAKPDQDLLSVFLTVPYEDGQYMTDEAIKDNILFVVAGGFETSSNTMANTLKFLAENPSILAQVLKEQLAVAAQKADSGLTWKELREMKYTWCVLQETTRLQPQVAAAFREVVTDVEYEGYTIPKGWKMIWSPNRSHKVPDFFPNPERFDPSRFEGGGPQPYTYLAFGGGPHTCPGMEYARMEMLIYFHYVVTRFQWSLVYPNEPICINPSPSPKWGLFLKISPRINV